MAVGKPIISTNIRGSADLVSNEQTGFLVDLDDSENLIKSIIELAENEEMRYEFGHNAKIKIEKYSINNVLKDMENIYSKLL